MDVKAKFHDSYFDFVFKAMTSEEGLLDLRHFKPIAKFLKITSIVLMDFFWPTSFPLSGSTLKST